MANTERMKVTPKKIFLRVIETVQKIFKVDSTYGDKLEPGVIVAKNELGGMTKGTSGAEAKVTPATYPVAPDGVPGNYVVKCTQAYAAASGDDPEVPEKWSVTNPNGDLLGYIELTADAKSADWDDEIRFTLADSSLNASVDDTATLIVAAGSGKLVVWNPASNKPYGILMEEANAKTADVAVNVLVAGKVDVSKLISLLGDEDAPVEAAIEELRMRNVICVEVL